MSKIENETLTLEVVDGKYGPAELQQLVEEIQDRMSKGRGRVVCEAVADAAGLAIEIVSRKRYLYSDWFRRLKVRLKSFSVVVNRKQIVIEIEASRLAELIGNPLTGERA